MFLRPQTLLAIAVATIASACIHVDDSASPDPYTYEIEPNDFALSAQGIGPIALGEQFLVRGHITDQGSDPYDGFAFQSDQPMDIEFSLFADDPAADFDLQLFDPYTGSTVASWETSANPECGHFSVLNSGVEFHLVVSSFVGSGTYTLEVRGVPLTWFGDGAGLSFAADGATRRADRIVDWTGYAAGKIAPEFQAPLPQLQVTTLSIDPETGHIRVADKRRWTAARDPRTTL